MDTFWDKHHSVNSEYWLSNYNMDMILKSHDIDKNINGIEVLDIGIGTGIFSKELYNKHNYVISCDISDVALKKIKPFVNETIHTTELKNAKPVDLAICNLVFQHCNDTEIERIIQDVQLKKNGIFSFQFAFLRETPNENVLRLIKNGSHYFRSLDDIKNMIERSNKRIVNISNPIHYYGDENISWYFVKVMNA